MTEEKIYDILIIGAGPAGLAASIYGARAGHSVLTVERLFDGGQMALTYEVENYPGAVKTDGITLATTIKKQAKYFGAEFENVDIKKLEYKDDIWIAHTGNKLIRAKTVIAAMGAERKKLGCIGEKQLAGRGVSYCATCDGGFFQDKTVAVVGGGDVAVEDAIYLSAICKKVYVIHRRNEFRASKNLVERMLKNANTEIMTPYIVDEIGGDTKVSSIGLRNAENRDKMTLAVDGVFVAVGNTPKSELLRGLTELDANGYATAGEDCKADMPGLFVAGDLRRKALYQIVTAAADGAVAASAACEYVSSMEDA